MNDLITYRELHTIDELNRVFDLEQSVWDMTPADAVPAALLISVAGNGGVVIGAEEDGELVGFAFGIPARKGKQWYLWSYMAGVAPEHQAQGIGVGLKAAQRQWALDHDYDVIKWTFDPMQRANANFNFRRLGVIAERYHVNRYGTMTDGLNAGMQSDRLEVTWNLTDPMVNALLSGEKASSVSATLPPHAILVAFEGDQIQTSSIDHSQPELYIEIPPDLALLKYTHLDVAQRWQLAMRESFIRAFDAGYIAQRMVTSPDGHEWYGLVRRPTA
jgi:predicted GNAT superfamily acetyltransferase